MAAAITALVAATAVYYAGRSGARVLSERELAPARALDLCEATGASLYSLRATGARDKAPLERVCAAQAADLRAALAACEDGELDELAASLPTDVADLGRLEPRTLELVAIRAGRLEGERAREASARTLDRRDQVVGVLVFGSLVAFLLVGLAVPSLVRARRLADEHLLRWHPNDPLEVRFAKTHGLIENLREMTTRQFAEQVDRVRSLAELGRALANREAAEQVLREIVRANEGTIRDLEVAQLVDPLTGVLGYNAFRDFTLNALADLLADGKRTCLLAFDLDDFKWTNERYGHGVGDLCIVRFARLLSECAAGRATAFRKSGDEFYLLVPEVTRDEAFAFADAVLSTINGSEVPFVTQSGEAGAIEIRASAGVLDFLEVDREHLERLGPDDRFIQTVGWADAGLSKAKHRGKGRAELYRTGMTQAYNPDEYPSQLDAVTRAVPQYYPNLPPHAKREFNRLVETLLAMVLPRRA